MFQQYPKHAPILTDEYAGSRQVGPNRKGSDRCLLSSLPEVSFSTFDQNPKKNTRGDETLDKDHHHQERII